MNIVVSSRILVHKDFHYIINGHCKNHFGHHFVEEGDYTIIRTTDNYIMDPSELANEVESEMIFEMSIVIWQRRAYQKKCPRCGHINMNAVTTESGWIEWQVPPGFVHVTGG